MKKFLGAIAALVLMAGGGYLALTSIPALQGLRAQILGVSLQYRWQAGDSVTYRIGLSAAATLQTKNIPPTQLAKTPLFALLTDATGVITMTYTQSVETANAAGYTLKSKIADLEVSVKAKGQEMISPKYQADIRQLPEKMPPWTTSITRTGGLDNASNEAKNIAEGLKHAGLPENFLGSVTSIFGMHLPEGTIKPGWTERFDQHATLAPPTGASPPVHLTLSGSRTFSTVERLGGEDCAVLDGALTLTLNPQAPAAASAVPAAFTEATVTATTSSAFSLKTGTLISGDGAIIFEGSAGGFFPQSKGSAPVGGTLQLTCRYTIEKQ